MKSVLISIQPKWCELIASGRKTIEVRKTRPKIETPFRCYIYETKARSDMPTFVDEDGHVLYTGRGQVIGEFICDNVFLLRPYTYDGGSADLEQRKLIQTFEGSSKDNEILSATCLSQDEIFDYIGVDNYGYGWHISDLKIYDKPRELSEFWAYNEELHKRYDSEEDFCCYNDTNEYGEALTDCGDAYNNILNCYRCWEEWSGWCHHVTRPPNSWMFVEEV